MSTADPIEPLLSLPGIGVAYAQRLLAIGILQVSSMSTLNAQSVSFSVIYESKFQPKCLLRQYIEFERDEMQFKSWIMNSCQSRSDHAHRCFEKIRTMDQFQTGHVQYKRPNLILPRRLSSHPLLEPPPMCTVRSMAFYSNGGSIKLVHPSELIRRKILKQSKGTEEGEQPPTPQHELGRMNTLNKKFAAVMSVANTKIRSLQIDLGRMEDISQDFSKISRQSTTTRRFAAIEESLHGFERTLTTLTANLNELTHSLGQHNDILKKVHRQSSAKDKEMQKSMMQFDERLRNYNLEIADAVQRNSETHRRIVKTEKLMEANVNAVLNGLRRCRLMEKRILSLATIAGVIFMTVLLNCADDKYFPV